MTFHTIHFIIASLEVYHILLLRNCDIWQLFFLFLTKVPLQIKILQRSLANNQKPIHLTPWFDPSSHNLIPYGSNGHPHGNPGSTNGLLTITQKYQWPIFLVHFIQVWPIQICFQVLELILKNSSNIPGQSLTFGNSHFIFKSRDATVVYSPTTLKTLHQTKS